MEYIAYFDIEGTPEDTCEVGIIIADSEERMMIDVACFYAIPENIQNFQHESRHCHGLNISNLKEIATCCQSQHELQTRVTAFLRKYNVKTIIGHDGPCLSRKSDNDSFLQRSGYSGYKYVNEPPLHNWAERDYQGYHCTALHFKKNRLPLLGVRCLANYSESIVVTQGAPRTVNAKSRAGGHCALYDSFESFLFHDGVL